MAAQTQPLTDDFRRYEALLWRVLSALARKGYFVPPGDARDLLHDFYLEAWPGLHERFDPRLSSFGTYIAAAFYRFARRRIVRLDTSAFSTSAFFVPTIVAFFPKHFGAAASADAAAAIWERPISAAEASAIMMNALPFLIADSFSLDSIRIEGGPSRLKEPLLDIAVPFRLRMTHSRRHGVNDAGDGLVE